ncbi:MAG: 2-amino-4-hydroxy-6-hydroxymethyldihydropteridine diphosphokinase [Saprospiraceae bacterium]|nr:2-amino-4-hydroxy-6-hydroxymethyldihydropteridine diphosphokinase [Saprospiraceae bacterium]
MKQNIYHLIIGGNLGDRVGQLTLAKKFIAEEVGSIKKESGIYETQPWGFDDQPWFLNQVLEVSSKNPPNVVLDQIKNIEIKAGRTPSEKWHARHIDIDILFYGELVLKENELEIPHPLLHTRNFVLVPLMDLAPEFLHPTLGKTIEELYLDCRDKGEVYIFNPDEQDNSL